MLIATSRQWVRRCWCSSRYAYRYVCRHVCILADSELVDAGALPGMHMRMRVHACACECVGMLRHVCIHMHILLLSQALTGDNWSGIMADSSVVESSGLCTDADGR